MNQFRFVYYAKPVSNESGIKS